MPFILSKGPSVLEYFPKKASTTLTVNWLAQFESAAGDVTICTAAPTRVAGVMAQTIASTDSDFSGQKKVAVVLPQANNEFLADVTGTLLTTHVGTQFAPSATGGYVDISNTTTPVIVVVGYISASQALVKFNGAYTFRNA